MDTAAIAFWLFGQKKKAAEVAAFVELFCSL